MRTESMAALLVVVQLDRRTGFFPRLDDAKAAVAKLWIIRGQRDESRRHFRWQRDWRHGAVDECDEIRANGVVRERYLLQCHRDRRESDHAHAIGVHMPLLRPCADERESGQAILRRER